MNKYLHILEYSSRLKIPERKKLENEFKYLGNIFRTSVVFSESKEQIKESFNPVYNNSKIDEKIIDLDDIVIYDNIDIKPEQDLVYVYECPVCLSKTISSEPEQKFCPQCEQDRFYLDILALINTDQLNDLKEMAVVSEDNKLMFIKEEKDEF